MGEDDLGASGSSEVGEGFFEKWRGQIECSRAQISEEGPH